MADYFSALKSDLVEQFRGKANIEALMEVIAAELQEVNDFYEQLRNERDVYTSVGKQLDGVGDIAVMTRMEAGVLSGNPIPFDVIDDETYRQYLIFKILKNTNNCTYPDIIKAFRMFWKYPLYYREDPEEPATMIFDTGELSGDIFTTPLFRVPLLRAAGVTLKLIARTSTPMPPTEVRILSSVGHAMTETYLPNIERVYHLCGELNIASGMSTYSEDRAPSLERSMLFNKPFHSGSIVHSVMETPISGLIHQKPKTRRQTT